MRNILMSLIKWFIKRDLLLVFFLAMGSVFLITQVPNLEIRADNEVLLNKKGVAYQNYTKFLELFSSDRILIALLEGDVFNQNNLRRINDFSQHAENIVGINDVFSITNAQGFEKSLFAIRSFPAYETWLTEKKALSWFKKAIHSNHFITKNLLAKDNSATLVLFVLDNEMSEDSRNNIVISVQQLLQDFSTKSLKATLTGIPFQEYVFLNNIKADQKNLVPLIFLFLALMCFIFLRGWTAITAALGSILLTILWTQGTVVWFGRYINPITSLLSPVIMVVSLAHIIHIFNHVSHHKIMTHENINKIILDVISQVGLPSFLAATTTSVGFFSLCVSDNPAIREFGFFAGVASFYSLFISFALSIILIKRIGVLDKKIDICFPKGLLSVFSRHLKRFRILIFLVGVVICGVVINGVFRLKVDTKLLNYLKNKDQIMHSINVIDNQFNGSNTLEIVLTLKQGTFFDYENFMMLHQLSQDLKSFSRIKDVNSFDDFIIGFYQVLVPGNENSLLTKDVLGLFYEEIKGQKNSRLNKFITKDFKTVRLSCFLPNSSTREILDMKHAIDKMIQSLDSTKVSFYITGRDFLFANMNDTLVIGQIRTVLWAGVPISLMVFLSLMSFRFGLAGIMAMGLPIAMTYGVMGLKGIPLNTATTMISSVAMGLLVDDTIHFLYRFRKEMLKEGATVEKSIEATLTLTGKAIIITSLILIGGFSVGIAGTVIPTVHFSILMGLAAFLSLLVNIIFLPVTLTIFASNRRVFE